MKITKIHIKDFQAFWGEYEIDLKDGRNLLLYGENGSGKSSLYRALDLFISSERSTFSHYKNIYVTEDDGFVKLEIGDTKDAPDTYEWAEAAHPSDKDLIRSASKTKGFLDYKALLETHYVQRAEEVVNVFELLVNSLLRDVHSPVFGSSILTLNDEWNFIRSILRTTYGKDRQNRINRPLADFNTAMTQILSDLTTKANQILLVFEQDVSIKLSMEGQGVEYRPAEKKVEEKIANRVVTLSADYYGQPIARHHVFLNEARLSAIAISIYLGARLLNPGSQLKVLFLDDVLIGLDVSNRLPLLDVLDKFFPDWQIILATYDKVWFDMAWQRVERTKNWVRGELHCRRDVQCDIPVYRGETDYLTVANRHLDGGDPRAAAIYARAAFEVVIKKSCNEYGLRIRYRENSKHYTTDDFWLVLKRQKLKTGEDLLDPQLVKDVELSRAEILNQLSHTAAVSPVRKEVEDGVNAVKKLEDRLDSVKKEALQPEIEPSVSAVQIAKTLPTQVAV